MDITMLIGFLTGGSLVATLLVGAFKSVLSDINARWGSLATQLLLLAVCILIATIMWAFQYLPANFALTVGLIFSGSIAIYEVLYKAVWQQAIMGKGI